MVGTEANLTVFRVPSEPHGGELTCTAENPISNVSSSVSTSALCEEPGSGAAHMAPWVIAVCVLVVIPLLLVLTLVHCLQKRRLRGIFCVSAQHALCPVQTLRNTEHEYTTSGTTVYAQVTRPRQETAVTVTMRDTESSTIYSTIQPHGESCPGRASVNAEQRESGRHQPSGSQEWPRGRVARPREPNCGIPLHTRAAPGVQLSASRLLHSPETCPGPSSTFLNTHL